MKPARDLFTVGQRVKPTEEGLRRHLWNRYRGVEPIDKRGRVVGFSSTRPTTVRVQWDGNKTSQNVHVDFVELVDDQEPKRHAPLDSDLCECGHVRDEHRAGRGECQAVDIEYDCDVECHCDWFNRDPDEEEAPA